MQYILLIKARRKLKLTQLEMSTALEFVQPCPLSTYLKWEYGTNKIPGWVEYAVHHLLENQRGKPLG